MIENAAQADNPLNHPVPDLRDEEEHKPGGNHLQCLLAAPVRTKINDRVPRITSETLFRKIAVHWISARATATGSSATFAITFSTIMRSPLPSVLAALLFPDAADSKLRLPGPPRG